MNKKLTQQLIRTMFSLIQQAEELLLPQRTYIQYTDLSDTDIDTVVDMYNMKKGA